MNVKEKIAECEAKYQAAQEKVAAQQAEEEARRAARWDAILARCTPMDPAEVEAERKRQLARVEELKTTLTSPEMKQAFVNDVLAKIGLAPAEWRAEYSKIPKVIQKSIEQEHLVSFGLVGGYGIGKSYALAGMLKRFALRQVKSQLENAIQQWSESEIETAIQKKSLGIRVRFRWCNWPNESVKMRSQISSSSDAVEAWIENLQNAPNLILDDIGADHATQQDWIGDALARVVDERLRDERTTYWTSNLDRPGLIERYGPRTFSRLMELAPMIILPAMPDLRLTKSNHRPA